MLDLNEDLARFTVVFDREAYDVPFFRQLWDDFRIAVLMYRKAVKDVWPVTDFGDFTAIVI